MISLNKRVVLLYAVRTKPWKSINNTPKINISRFLFCSSLSRNKNKTLSSVLFTPVPVKPYAQESEAGEELSGKLNKVKLVAVLNKFFRKPELKKLAEDNELDGENLIHLFFK